MEKLIKQLLNDGFAVCITYGEDDDDKELYIFLANALVKTKLGNWKELSFTSTNKSLDKAVEDMRKQVYGK